MFPTRFDLADILVLAGTAGAGGMAVITSTRISARLKCVLEHVSPGRCWGGRDRGSYEVGGLADVHHVVGGQVLVRDVLHRRVLCEQRSNPRDRR